MCELFDASVGAGSVLAPYGGASQKTPTQVMAGLIPVQSGETNTCSVMAFGFDPYLSERDEYAGARFAVTTSIAKIVAAGANPDDAYLTFQEYFEKLRREPERWGKPLGALLGALDAQMSLGAAAIGGKDSMSGTFMDMDVPPTLVSFAVAPADARTVISPEFKAAGRKIVVFEASDELESVKKMWKNIHALIKGGKIASAWAVTGGGIAEAVMKMSFGNAIGARLKDGALKIDCGAGAIVAEIVGEIPNGAAEIGETISEPTIFADGEGVEIAELLRANEGVLESVFPTFAEHSGEAQKIEHTTKNVYAAAQRFAKPRAVVFAFPGTNSEIDTQRALERAGANAEIVVVRNLTPQMLRESVERGKKAIERAQIVVLPGGFSGGDEPDGSAKFITAFFRARELTEATHELLKARDGLMLGICNGFQALIKLGLVPYGEIIAPNADAPTLTHNIIGRHMARYAYTRVASNASPWAGKMCVGEVYAVPLSHGEGRFVCSENELKSLAQGGQIATQYCDENGGVSMDISVNANGSALAVEGLYSPDGRVFGKMGHTERRGEFVGKNIYGNLCQPVFESGVAYYL